MPSPGERKQGAAPAMAVLRTSYNSTLYQLKSTHAATMTDNREKEEERGGFKPKRNGKENSKAHHLRPALVLPLRVEMLLPERG